MEIVIDIQQPIVTGKIPCHICGAQFSSKYNEANHNQSFHDGKNIDRQNSSQIRFLTLFVNCIGEYKMK